MSSTAGRADRRRIVGGGLSWLLGLEYFAAEASALHAATHYSMAIDTISKLGIGGCCAAFCSPLHAAMNAGILLSGLRSPAARH